MVTINYESDSIEIENALELFVVLDDVPYSHHQLLMDQINTKMQLLIKNDKDFLKILPKIYGIKGESKRNFLLSLESNLRQIITEGKTICHSLAILYNEDDQQLFLDILGNEFLRQRIRTLEEICGCLEWLFGKKDFVFIDMLGWDYILEYLRDGESIGTLLRYLNDAEELQFIEKFGWKKLVASVHTSTDLYYVLNGLDTENERTFLELLTTEKLREILPHADQLEEVCKRYLSDSDSAYITAKYYKK